MEIVGIKNIKVACADQDFLDRFENNDGEYLDFNIHRESGVLEIRRDSRIVAYYPSGKWLRCYMEYEKK